MRDGWLLGKERLEMVFRSSFVRTQEDVLRPFCRRVVSWSPSAGVSEVKDRDLNRSACELAQEVSVRLIPVRRVQR